MRDLPYYLELNGQIYTRGKHNPRPPGPSYSDCLRTVRDLIGIGVGDAAHLASVNSEYIRGQIELLIDLFGMRMEEKSKVCGDLGLPPDAANVRPSPPPSRYKMANVSLDEGIELIGDAALSLIRISRDGRCRTLRDYYTLMGTEEALRSLLGSDEKDAHDVIVDRFAEAARSPEEEAAIRAGDLDKPLVAMLHNEHRDAVCSVLIREIRNNTGLIAEILAAAETGV